MNPTTCSSIPPTTVIRGEKIPEGSYEIDDINNTIHHEMEKRGYQDPINVDYYINISANSNTLKSVFILEEEYEGGFHENVVNILSINSILVNIDIISGSFVNGTTKNTTYFFFPNVSPG